MIPRTIAKYYAAEVVTFSSSGAYRCWPILMICVTFVDEPYDMRVVNFDFQLMTFLSDGIHSNMFTLLSGNQCVRAYMHAYMLICM